MRRALDGLAALAARVPLWAAYLAIGLPSVLMMALLVPLGQVADEPAHLTRAAALADGQWVGHRAPSPQPDGSAPVVPGVDVDPAIDALSPWIGARLHQAAPDRAAAPGWTGERRFVALHTIATYMPAFYVPTALGFGAAKLAGADPLGAALAGRVAGGLAVLLVGALALRIAVQGQAILFAVLAVPMTLSLAASFNQDALIVAASALAAACMTRVVAEQLLDRVGTASHAGAVAALALVVAAKPPYAPLAAMLLVPLPVWNRRLDRRLAATQALGLALALLPALLWGWFVIRGLTAPIPRPAYEAGPLWPGARPATFRATDPAAQLGVLLAKPFRLVGVPWHYLTSANHLRGLFQGAVGILGWLDIFLPTRFYYAWLAAFALSLWALVRPVGPVPPRAAARYAEGALLVLAAMAALWGVLLSQYLSWSDVGQVSIDGPQGRYLLPILPLLALLPPRDGRRLVPSDLRAGWAPALMALVGIGVLYGVAARYGAGCPTRMRHTSHLVSLDPHAGPRPHSPRNSSQEAPDA